MKLSILIPMYNASKYIGNCLESLINQDIPKSEYEIIVIDDGSTDNSSEIVDKYVKTNTNIYKYSQSNQGLGATRNVGIEIAKGEYIYFLDADDYIIHNVFGFLLEKLETFNLDLIGFNTHTTSRLDLFGSQSRDINDNFEVISGREFCSSNEDFLVMVCWYFVKRELLIEKNIRFTEGRFLEDGPFTFRLFLEIKRMKHFAIDIHRYVKVPTSIMNNESLSHLNKLIQDYLYVINDFKSLKRSLINQNKKKLASYIQTIDFWSDVNTYMLFYRFIKANLSIKRIDNILKDLKENNAYPINNFTIGKYNTKKHKLIVMLFNNKTLFYMVLYPLRILHRIKWLKLP